MTEALLAAIANLATVEHLLHLALVVMLGLAIGAGSCMLLARPIARLTTIPFNLLAPFMIVVVSFVAYHATRQFMDLAAAANLLLVELPGGLIAQYVDQPWLTGQIR